MIPLAQRLRELSDQEFESLVHQVLLSRFPGAGIKKVDGAGGDKGVDSFLGTLSDGPSIWQSKNFKQRVGKPQKAQIEASIKSALSAYTPKHWTLCVPIDLRSVEHEWFQDNIVACYQSRTQVELITASDLLRELASNRILRDAFFPDSAISNALHVRRMATNSEQVSSRQQEQITLETAQLFLERNIELEPRLEPVLGVSLSKPLLRNNSLPGAVFSITRGNLSIDYFPRDPIAYQLDPIGFHITLGREHSDALEAALDRGVPITLPAGALLKLDSSSQLFRELFEGEDHRALALEVRPSVHNLLANKEMPLRFVAGLAPNQIELPYLPFKVSRPGRKEITLTSESRLPLRISLTLHAPPRNEASIKFQPQMVGGRMVDLATVINFISALEQSRCLDVFTLDPPAPFLRDMTELSLNLNIPPETRKLILDCAAVERHFKIPLHMPTQISEKDRRGIDLLRLIASGESFPGTELTLQVIKHSEYVDGFLKLLGDSSPSVRLDNPPNFRTITIFGRPIDCYPLVLIADEVTVADSDETRRRYLDASEGAVVEVRVVSKGSCRFIHSQEPFESRIESDPGPAIQCS